MSLSHPEPPETVPDALARRMERGRTTTSAWTVLLREVGAVDRAIYDAVARTPTAELDGHLSRLSNAASYSRLWLGIAAALALLGGARGRRAALEAVAAVAVTSATVNLGVKPFAQRRRPTRVEAQQGGARRVRMPRSSFPSGHAASAAAFAYAVGRHLPVLAVPLQLLAGAVGYSRVHASVHYPPDVAVGSSVGTGTAAAVAAVCDRVLLSPRGCAAGDAATAPRLRASGA